MTIEWSGLGPELLLVLDRDAPESLTAQLEDALRAAIRARRLAPGERLPSSRALARELGLSRGLIQECYSQLLAEGFLTSRSGSGTRVAESAHQAPALISAPAVGARVEIDFEPGRPDLMSFPRQDWMWAMREASRTAPAEAFGYGDPRGSEPLREVLASYLRRVRGAVTDPERIVVCNGYAQGSNLVLRELGRRGVELMAVEDPGEEDPAESMDRWGMPAVPIRVDEQGIDVAALADSGARAVVLTPAHQSPTGVVLGPARRRGLVEWADARGAVIIEDDYDAEFRYDREPVGALQGLAPERVALIGTVSKSLAPALRLGWIVCPTDLADALAAAKEQGDRGSPGLDQLALAILIESGRYDKHLRRMRGVYAGKRQALIDALARFAPGLNLTGLAAGFHGLLRLPDGVDPARVAEASAERSVGLHPVVSFGSAGPPRPPELVIGFGALSEAQIRRGIELVADLLLAG